MSKNKNAKFELKIERSDNIAFINADEGKKFTYSQFMDYIDYFASMINEKPGTKIAIAMENRAEWPFALYAIWSKRCIAVPIDYMLEKKEIDDLLEHSDSKMSFCSEKTSYLVKGKKINVDDLDLSKAKKGKDKVKNFSKNLDDIGAIIYTSGTSGKPQGVVLTKKNLVTNAGDVIHINRFKEGAPFYTFAPLFHSAGFMGMNIIAVASKCTIIHSAIISPENISKILKEYKIKIFAVVPRFAYLIHQKIMAKINSNKSTKAIFNIARKLNVKVLNRAIFGKVKSALGKDIEMIICGGSSLDIDVQKDLSTCGIELCSSYGLTEASPTISFSTPWNNTIGSVGEVVRSLDIKIVDDEIWVRGDSIFEGYYKNPDLTDSVFFEDWFKTGDLGYLNKNKLYISGRKKELIVLSNSKNIWPDLIEQKLEKENKVIKECMVFEEKGSLQIVVVPDEKEVTNKKIGNLSAFIDDIIAEYNIKVADYKKIQKVIIVSSDLPRTKLGKLRRFQVKEIVENRATKKEIKRSDSNTFIKIEEFMKRNYGQTLSLNYSIDLDLEFDSLKKIELMEFIRREFKIDISSEDIANTPIIEDLIAFIDKKKSMPYKKIVSKKRDKIPKKYSDLFISTLSTLFKGLYKIKVVKSELDKSRQYIFAANHLSIIDWYFAYSALDRDIAKNTLCLAKDKLLLKGWYKVLSKRSNLIVFNIDDEFEKAITRIEDAIKEGKNIFIFPEGTRSRDGNIKEFKKSFAKIAERTGLEVVPVTIKGTFDILPPGRKIPNLKGDVEIIFDSPMKIREDEYIKVQDIIKSNLES